MTLSNFQTVDEAEKLLSDCVCSLYCPRKRFYPKKDYGSQIRLYKDLSEEYLLAYARQGLSDFDGVYVKSVKKEQSEITFNLLINDEERTVTIPYETDL
ncbi:MAG: hypothetical protein ACI4V4_04860 [Eubacterium sp.]